MARQLKDAASLCCFARTCDDGWEGFSTHHPTMSLWGYPHDGNFRKIAGKQNTWEIFWEDGLNMGIEARNVTTGWGLKM